ncbi:MAG: Mth938-like domain-containing protein, partial [Comamonadaceae bacterium]|nr:Mth938-like domain-containing protein [Comamonadaceae bacterium]
GLEVMDTAAACRTFNILVGEGRRVLAGLILERSAEPMQEPAQNLDAK